MQVKELKSEGLSRELEVIVPLKTIEGHVESRLLEVGKTVKIQGFRPGKVPLNILKQRYGRAILGEVLERTVNESSAKALEEQKIKPAMQPHIEVKEFEDGKDLTYTMAVDVLPEIKLMDLSKIKVEKPVAKVDAKEIDASLERIAESNMESKKIEGDRATKDGDVVVIDFDGRTADDDKHHDGMKAEGHKLELGSGQFIPGFEEQLVGKKAGDEVEVKVGFPEEYQAAELAGREAIFDDVKAVREAIEQQMKGEYEQFTRMKLKRALLDQLDEGHTLEAPERMIEAEFEAIEKQAEREAAQNPDAEKMSDDDKAELQEIAARRVRLGLVLSEIGSTNNISVADQELQQAVIREAQKYPGQEKAVFEFYQKNPQALESMRAPLFEEKVVDFILEKADVKEVEVSVEELTADDEDEKPKAKKKPAAKKSTAKKSTAKKKDAADDKGEEKKPAAKKKAPAKKKAAAK